MRSKVRIPATHRVFARPRSTASIVTSGLALGGGLLCAEVNAAGLFTGGLPTYEVGAGVQMIRTADLDADGSLDIVVLTSQNAVILRGQPDGELHAPIAYPSGLQEGPYYYGQMHLEIADLNADGALDLALTGGSSASVLLGAGDASFGAPNLFGGPGLLRTIAVGDLNGDGWLDLAAAAVQDSAIAIWTGQGDGTFAASSEVDIDPNPYAVSVIDANGDGHADLACASYDALTIRLGRGDGTFAPAVAQSRSPGLSHLRATDLDKDGSPDLVVASEYGSTQAFRSAGDGTFAPTTTMLNGLATGLATGDVNGDGWTDIVVSTEYMEHHDRDASNVTIFLGLGDATFGERLSLDPVYDPQCVEIADLNADGHDDVVVGSYSAIHVLFGREGDLPGGNTFETGPLPIALVSGDLDGDEMVDLAVVSTALDAACVHTGRGSGAFAPRAEFITGADPYSIAVADMNGDGSDDLITSNLSASTVSILLGLGDGRFGTNTDFGTGGPPGAAAVADVNGDENLDVVALVPGALAVLLGDGRGFLADPRHLSTQISGGKLALEDLNLDGHVDAVLTSSASNSVAVLLGTAGTFGSPLHYATGPRPRSVVTAHIDADAGPDLAVAYEGGVAILLGSGNGTFVPANPVVTGQLTYDLAIGDLDRDGSADLVTSNARAVELRLGDGTGSFRNAAIWQTGKFPNALQLFDADADADLDLAVTNGGSDDVTVLLNQSRPTAVLVEDFVAARVPSGVLLEWRLAAEELHGVETVHVQRTETPDGVSTTIATLAPAARMTCIDAHGVSGREAWYRLVLELAGSARMIVGPVHVEALGASMQTTLQTPFDPRDGGSIPIRYSIGDPHADVRLELFDARGRRIRSLVDEPRERGRYVQHWDRTDRNGMALARGVYLVHLAAGATRITAKLVLLGE